MKRTPIQINPSNFPAALSELLLRSRVYDSSCSPEARVYFLDVDGGYYLKTAPRGSLANEASMTRFFDAYGRDRVDFECLRTVAACECFG